MGAIALDLITQNYFGVEGTGINYAQIAEYTEKFDKDLEIKRVLICRWKERHDFIRRLLPNARVGPKMGATPIKVLTRPIGDTAPVTYSVLDRYEIQRHHPEQHPQINGAFAMAAEVIEGLGVPVRDGTNSMDFYERNQLGVPVEEGYAKVIVTYRYLPFIVRVDDAITNIPDTAAVIGGSELARYVSRTIKPATDSYGLPGHTMMEHFTGNDIPENIPATFPKMHVSYTWHMVPCVPCTAHLLQGYVSDKDQFDRTRMRPIVGVNRYAGDALYLHSEIGPIYNISTGVAVRDITYHLLYKQPSNNLIFRSSRRDFLLPTLTPEFYGWVLPHRKLAAPFVIAHNRETPHPPGTTIYNYARLESLFMAISPDEASPALVY